MYPLRRGLLLLMLLACLPAASVAAQQETDVPPPLTFDSADAPDNRCALSPRFSDPSQSCQVTIPGSVRLEVADFEPDAEVDLVVESPDGNLAALRMQLEGEQRHTTWDWPAMPGDPIGSYRVTATSQHHRLETTLSVDPAAAEPRSFVFPSQARAGATFSIALAGFEPHADVPLDLHRALDCSVTSPQVTYKSASPLVSVRVDQAGQAIVQLPTLASDSTCAYAIETQPSSARVQVSQFQVAASEAGNR